jgi:hypothetical protein
MNSNNPLAVELETENDIARESFFAFSFIISLRLQGDSNDQKKDLFK